ncbi:MAG: serine hydrolase domain-containing protein, partial [Candidatus Bipolaricaulota bacterium]
MPDWKVLDEVVRERMRRTRLPGLSMAVVRREEVLHTRAFGFRDLSRRLPASPHTVYGIGSISKSFAALSILKLAEEGELSLDDRVDRFLPLQVQPYGEPIRIWHLLTHSSGIPALGYAEGDIRSGQGTGGRYTALSAIEDFVDWLNDAEDWVEARPGERWLYLNEGYIILGGIIEQLTGLSFADYVRAEILDPLELQETGFLGEDLGPELAVPYIIPSEGQPKAGKVLPIPIGSDGGLASSALDMVKYLGVYLREGSPLISRETYQQMVAPRVSLPHVPAPFSDASQGSYAYGLMVQP